MRSLLVAVMTGLLVCASAWAATPVRPLAASQLTDTERSSFQSLSDKAAQKAFLITRAYLRICEKVLKHQMPTLDLPVQPDEYDGQYVSPAEQKQVDAAQMAYITALLAR